MRSDLPEGLFSEEKGKPVFTVKSHSSEEGLQKTEMDLEKVKKQEKAQSRSEVYRRVFPFLLVNTFGEIEITL